MDKITIFIVGVNRQEIPIDVKKKDKIIDIKRRLNHSEKTCYKCNGSVLKNENTLEFYEIENEDKISTNIKVIGGIIKKNRN